MCLLQTGGVVSFSVGIGIADGDGKGKGCRLTLDRTVVHTLLCSLSRRKRKGRRDQKMGPPGQSRYLGSSTPGSRGRDGTGRSRQFVVGC